jgi:hypothetical protein
MDYADSISSETSQNLEDIFFAQQDQKLVEQLQKLRQLQETKENLKAVSGITDDAVLQKLIDLKIRPKLFHWSKLPGPTAILTKKRNRIFLQQLKSRG